MSARRVYDCNLCRETIHPDKNDGAVAVWFRSAPNNRFEFVRVDYSEAEGAHICGKCMKQLRELFGRKKEEQ